MTHREPECGRTVEPGDMDDFEAEPRLNQSDSINLSTLTMIHGSGLAAAFDRGAGPRVARIVGQANRGKGGDHTCAFS